MPGASLRQDPWATMFPCGTGSLGLNFVELHGTWWGDGSGTDSCIVLSSFPLFSGTVRSSDCRVHSSLETGQVGDGLGWYGGNEGALQSYLGL